MPYEGTDGSEHQEARPRCEGGPCDSRLEVYPPRLEIEERTGIYVLDDGGLREHWRYVFHPRIV